MNEIFKIDREFLLKNTIYEITSISCEHNYDINGSFCEGEFIVSGDYRLHEISINKEDFSFKIPFNHELRSNINLDSVEVDIIDFRYELINEDELKVYIEYTINAEESLIEFEDATSLNEFLDKNDADVVMLNDERTEELITESIEENIPQDNRNNSIDDVNQNTILDSINSSETYVKYHIHTVTIEDSVDSILNKYKISITDLKKYNSFENLELNMKLLIPDNEDN